MTSLLLCGGPSRVYISCMSSRFPRIVFVAAMLAIAPAFGFAQDDPHALPNDPHALPKKKPPEAPAKLPKVGADKTRGLDFLFGDRKSTRLNSSH